MKKIINSILVYQTLNGMMFATFDFFNSSEYSFLLLYSLIPLNFLFASTLPLISLSSKFIYGLEFDFFETCL